MHAEQGQPRTNPTYIQVAIFKDEGQKRKRRQKLGRLRRIQIHHLAVMAFTEKKNHLVRCTLGVIVCAPWRHRYMIMGGCADDMYILGIYFTIRTLLSMESISLVGASTVQDKVSTGTIGEPVL